MDELGRLPRLPRWDSPGARPQGDTALRGEAAARAGRHSRSSRWASRESWATHLQMSPLHPDFDFLPPAQPDLSLGLFSNKIPVPLQVSSISEELEMTHTRLSFWSRFWAITNHRSLGSKAAGWGGREKHVSPPHVVSKTQKTQHQLCNGTQQRPLTGGKGKSPSRGSLPDEPLPRLACRPCLRPHCQTRPEHTHTRARRTGCGERAEMYSNIQCPYSRLPLKFTTPWMEIALFRLNLNNR